MVYGYWVMSMLFVAPDNGAHYNTTVLWGHTQLWPDKGLGEASFQRKRINIWSSSIRSWNRSLTSVYLGHLFQCQSHKQKVSVARGSCTQDATSVSQPRDYSSAIYGGSGPLSVNRNGCLLLLQKQISRRPICLSITFSIVLIWFSASQVLLN